jgi:hypothetical protein
MRLDRLPESPIGCGPHFAQQRERVANFRAPVLLVYANTILQGLMLESERKACAFGQAFDGD